MAYARNEEREQEKALALVEVQPPRLPYPIEAKEEGVSEGQWKALVDAVFPSAQSVDGVLLALRYAKARGLDIFKRVVHVVPMWNSKLGRNVETVWPGIGELRTTASRTGAHAGNDDCVFGPTKSKIFKDRKTRQGRGGKSDYVEEAECKIDEYPEWAQITVYKIVQGQRVAFVGPKVRFMETFSGMKGLQVPNDRWQRAPFQMLEKCAEAAALRRAFPDELGDSWSAEEMEGRDLGADGSIEAEYTITAEEDRPTETAKAPTRASSAAQRDPEQELLDWWGPGGLEDFMEYSRTGLADANTVKSLKAVDKYLTDQADAIAHLPAKDRTEFDSYVDAARARIRAAKAPAEKTPEPAKEAEPRDNGAYTAEDYERYLTRLQGFCDAAKTPVDVNSLKSREKVSIGQLPAEYQTRANAMLDAAMAAAKKEGSENV